MTAVIDAAGVIREAVEADVPALVRMGLSFVDYQPLPIPMCAGDLRQAVVGLMQNPDAIVLVAGSDPYALLLGIAMPLWFAPRTMVASELAWWVDPDKRGGSAGIRLLRAFENWAEARGIEHIAMSAIESDLVASAGPLIERRGYKVVERIYNRRN